MTFDKTNFLHQQVAALTVLSVSYIVVRQKTLILLYSTIIMYIPKILLK